MLSDRLALLSQKRGLKATARCRSLPGTYSTGASQVSPCLTPPSPAPVSRPRPGLCHEDTYAADRHKAGRPGETQLYARPRHRILARTGERQDQIAAAAPSLRPSPREEGAGYRRKRGIRLSEERALITAPQLSNQVSKAARNWARPCSSAALRRASTTAAVEGRRRRSPSGVSFT